MTNSFTKITKLQNDNPTRYCNLEGYKEGYVCFMDILGFSDFASDEKNFILIRDTINDFISYQIGKEVNENIFNVSIGSDSIIISIDKENVKRLIDMINLLEYIIRNIIFLRKLIIKKIGTDIRAGITYGKYVHEGYKNQLYFGPAICKAVKISEKCKEISCEYGTANQPAGIYIDDIIFKMDIEQFYNYEKYLKKLNTGNYILNPYIFEFYNLNPYTYYFQIENGEAKKNMSKFEWWKLYCKKNRIINDKHNLDVHKDKYLFYTKMLKDFEENYVEKINRAEIMK